MKKLLAIMVTMMLVICPTSHSTITARASGTSNIVARANYLYGITWTAQKTVDGWKNRDGNRYYAGNTYHIPYGQPASVGKYICWDISVEDFVKATQNANSDFYTKRSSYNGQESVYYAMDCSAFASYCWGLNYRSTTSMWSSLPVNSLGACNMSTVYTIEPGDTLCLAGSHIVLVTDVGSTNGQMDSVEITEETPKELRKVRYSLTDLVAKYNAYTIYRYKYRDSVTPPPNAVQNESPTPKQTTVVQSGASCTVSVHQEGVKSGVAVVVAYKDGKMQSAKITTIGTDEPVEFGGEVDMFRVMLWESLANLKPLCKPQTIAQSEWTRK